MPKKIEKSKESEENSDKNSLLELVQEGYKTSDSYRSINSEYKTHRFVGTFHDMDMIETKFGISNRYVFKEKETDELCALLSSSKNIHSIILQHVVRAGPKDIEIWKDKETGYWLLNFLE